MKTPTIVAPSARAEQSEGGYGSLNAESSLDTTCSQKSRVWSVQEPNCCSPAAENSLVTSASLCRFAISSSTGECGLLAGAPLIESSRPLGSSLGLLAALGFTSLASTAVTAGGEGGFALTDGSAGGDGTIPTICFSNDNKGILPISRIEPATVMDMPCSWASGAALVAGESSTKSFLGEPTL